MSVSALPRRYPIPTLTTVVFAVALVVTVVYFAGLVPGVPKTLPTFVDLMRATGVLLVLSVLAWAVSFATE
jgi:Na+(H+)/acetate symporter ActP